MNKPMDPLRSNIGRSGRNLSAVLSTMVFLLLFYTGCKKEEAADSTPPVTVDVHTVPIRTGHVDRLLEATGSTAIQKEIEFRSPIGGILVDFKFFNGDRISKGTVIARIRTKESQAAIQGAQVLIQSAQTPEQAEEAKKAYSLAEQSSTTVSIVAPFDGVLADKQKNEMEFINEGDPVAGLVDPSSLVFIANVPSSSLNLVHTGEKAYLRFSSLPGRTLNGIVNRIEPMLNSTDQTAKARILFTPPAEVLKGSMFGTASIVTGEIPDALLIPRSALLVNDQNNTSSIIIAGTDSLAHDIPVRVAWMNDTMVAIQASAIAAGMNVITEGNYGLPDSTKIRVVH